MNSWKDVTVGEFIELSELAFDDLSPTEYQLERIATLTGEAYDELDEDEVNELIKQYKWLDLAPRSKPKQKIDGYELKPMKRVTFGDFITLDKLVTEQAPILVLNKILALLYDFEDYDRGQSIANEWSVEDCYQAMENYLEHRKQIAAKLSDGDDETEEDDQPTEISDSATWEMTLYDLAGGDVTKAQEIFKLPHLLVINWILIDEAVKSRQRSQTGVNHSSNTERE
jgi:hypothetical protein